MKQTMRLSNIIPILFLFTLIVLPLSVSAATQYFDWDAESGTFADTFDVYNDPSAVSISTTRAHSGTKSVYYNPYEPGADQTNPPVVYVPNINTMYVTWWWWIPSALEGGEGGQHFFRFGSSAIGNSWEDGQLDPAIAAPGATGFGVDLFDGVGGDSLTLYHSIVPSLPTNQWFKFALVATINSPAGTANGALRIWINDAEVYSNSSVLFATTGATAFTTTKWNRFFLVTNFDNATLSTGYWYMDDIQVWDGVPTEGGDTIPPTAPSGLGVQ
jgi:hypothetical protein